MTPSLPRLLACSRLIGASGGLNTTGPGPGMDSPLRRTLPVSPRCRRCASRHRTDRWAARAGSFASAERIGQVGHEPGKSADQYGVMAWGPGGRSVITASSRTGFGVDDETGRDEPRCGGVPDHAGPCRPRAIILAADRTTARTGARHGDPATRAAASRPSAIGKMPPVADRQAHAAAGRALPRSDAAAYASATSTRARTRPRARATSNRRGSPMASVVERRTGAELRACCPRLGEGFWVHARRPGHLPGCRAPARARGWRLVRSSRRALGAWSREVLQAWSSKASRH
jgi:hypothetical protein